MWAQPLSIKTEYFQKPPVQIAYPQVTAGTKKTAIQRMNETIRKDYQRLMKQQDYPSPQIREMIGQYELKTNERSTLSLTQLNYSFSGGAHGNTLLSGLNFETTTGKNTPLSELFKPGSNYVEILNGIIRKQIAARKLPVFEPFKTIAPDQTYYLADKALVIFFQLYELLPYVYGFPYFPISVYEVQDIVLEDGLFGRMIS